MIIHTINNKSRIIINKSVCMYVCMFGILNKTLHTTYKRLTTYYLLCRIVTTILYVVSVVYGLFCLTPTKKHGVKPIENEVKNDRSTIRKLPY